MYVRSSSVILNDGFTMNVSSRLRRKNFATLSVVYAQHIDSSRKDSTLNPVKQGQNGCPCILYHFRDRSNYVQGVKDESDAQDAETPPAPPPSTYANMIARYRDALKGTSISRNGIRNLPHISFTKSFEDLASLLKLRNVETFEKRLPYEKSLTVYNSFAEHAGDISWSSEAKETRWSKQVNNVVYDLKHALRNKEGKSLSKLSQGKQYEITQPETVLASWLDRVVEAHRARFRIDESALNENVVHAKNDETNNERDMASSRNLEQSCSAFSSSMSEYINRGPINQARTTKNDATQNVVSGEPGSGEEPKVELRMASSQNDSVVSINVDPDPYKNSTSANELSVVVQSNKNVAVQPSSSNRVLVASPTLRKSLDSNHQTANSKLNSMRISISEESVPVKQIEFAINGRPVSQLKTIIARSEKLDVVTSIDKIEIRVPFTNNKAKIPVDHTKTMMQGIPISKPVLNLQISASFDESQAQQYGYTPFKTDVKAIPNPPTASGSNSTYPRYSTKQYTANEGNSPKSLSSNALSPKSTQRSKTIDSTETHGRQSTKVSSKDSQVLGSNTPSKYPDRSSVHQSQKSTVDNKRLSEEQVSKRTTFTKENNPNRMPSNMIPWWSSEEPYNRLKKKSRNVDSPSSNLHLKKSEKQGRSETMKESKRYQKLTGVSSHKAHKLVNTIAPFSPRRTANAKQNRALQPTKPAKSAGKKKQQYIWQRIPEVVQNVDGVNIKMKEKVDYDTIHVQDQLKSNASTSKTSTTKTEKSPKLTSPDEKSKIFHRDSVIVKTETIKSPKTTEKVTKEKSSEEKLAKEAKDETSKEGSDSNKLKKDDKAENIFLTDQAVKNFMDAMKPILKKDDGTLIDFGMNLSSRRMPEKQTTKLNKFRSKSANIEKIKGTPILSKVSQNTSEKISTNKEKTLPDKKEIESTVRAQKADEEKNAMSNKPQVTVIDAKTSSTDPTNITESNAPQSATSNKNVGNIKTSPKSAVKASGEKDPFNKADAPKTALEDTQKKSPNEMSTVRFPQSTVELPNKPVNNMRSSNESMLRDSSQIPLIMKKVMRPENDRLVKQPEKKVVTYSVESKIPSITSPLAQTVVHNISLSKNKIELAEKRSPNTTTNIDTLSEKAGGTDSAQLSGTIVGQSLKKIPQFVTKGENAQEKALTEKIDSGLKKRENTNTSSDEKSSKVAAEVAAMKECKADSSLEAKTDSEPRKPKPSKPFTNTDNPNRVNNAL